MVVAVSKDVAKLVEKQVDLPAVPTVAAHVVEELSNPHWNAVRLGEIISHDPALTGRILRIANSAMYRRRIEITSLQDALVRIGANTIKSMVMALSTKALFRDFGPIEVALWEHSMACAIATQTIANRVPGANKNQSFVAGLLHDVGKVVLFNSDPDKFEQAINKCRYENLTSVQAEQAVFSFDHAEVGVILLQKWALSAELQHMVYHHHDIDGSDELPPSERKLTQMMMLADKICLSLGLGVVPLEEEPDWEMEPAAIALGMNSDFVASLAGEIRELFDVERSLFD